MVDAKWVLEPDLHEAGEYPVDARLVLVEGGRKQVSRMLHQMLGLNATNLVRYSARLCDYRKVEAS